MIRYALPLSEIHNLHPIAESLSAMVAEGANEDISTEFPSTAGRYKGDSKGFERLLAESRERFQIGQCEDIVLFAGKIAVGMSQIARCKYAVPGMEPGLAMLSSYLGHDWRGQGIGRLSMNWRIDEVNKNFDGQACTLVKKDNKASNGLVTSTPGFKLVGISGDSYIYMYDRPSKITV